jgi:hypothetical protein
MRLLGHRSADPRRNRERRPRAGRQCHRNASQVQVALVRRGQHTAEYGDPERSAELARQVTQRRPDALLRRRKRVGDPTRRGCHRQPHARAERDQSGEEQQVGLVASSRLKTTKPTAMRSIIDQLAERLGGADATARAGAFSTQMAGVIFSRYLLRLEPIASMSADDVVRRLAPSLALTIAPSPSGRKRSRR